MYLFKEIDKAMKMFLGFSRGAVYFKIVRIFKDFGGKNEKHP